MSFSLGEKDKASNSKKVDTQKHPLETITDPARHDELERGGMIMGPHHPGFRSESHEIQQQQLVQTGVTRLPEGSVPPGARFDPIVPGDESRLNRVGSGQHGLQPIAGPDPDELLPPNQEPPQTIQQQPSLDNPSQDPTRSISGFGGINFGGGSGGEFHF